MMGKFIPDAKIDIQLEQTEGDNLHVCSAQPTTYLEATVTFNIATQSISALNYAKSDGDVNGRKNTLTPPIATVISFSGTADHVAITTTAGSVLEQVTTNDPIALTAGGLVDVGFFEHEINEPS